MSDNNNTLTNTTTTTNRSTLSTSSLSRGSTTGSISLATSSTLSGSSSSMMSGSISSSSSSGLLSKPSLMSTSSRSVSSSLGVGRSISVGSSATLGGSMSSLGMGGGGMGGTSSTAASSAASSSSSAAVTTSSSSENLPPRTLARVARDVRDLVKNPPEGVRLVLDGETGMPGSLSEILAEIEGPEQTPYHTHYFQLKLCLSTDFPSTPPRGYFLTKIYHPNVDPTTGAICVNTLKKDWTPTTSLSHVLTVIRCLLIVPFPESSLNDEAGKNFMESYDEYARRAKLLAGVHGLKSWSSEVYNNSSNDSGHAKGKVGSTESEVGGKSSASSGGNNENAKSGKMAGRSNIVRANSKSMDKKNKKKSLKRL